LNHITKLDQTSEGIVGLGLGFSLLVRKGDKNVSSMAVQGVSSLSNCSLSLF